jgi:hypothetical protein
MAKFVAGGDSARIFEALHVAGAFTDDPAYIRRVVIDLQYREPAKIYIERYADDTILEVLRTPGLLVDE